MRKRIVVGFDGFVDTLLHCVDRRLTPYLYRRLGRIEQYAERIGRAAGKSMNMECVVQAQTLGGNAPLLAQALTSLGHTVDLVGTLGFPTIHPLFQSLSSEGCRLHSIGDPGLTDAFEFTNGKLLLGKMGELGHLSLKTIFTRFKERVLASLIKDAKLIATANWTMMPAVGQFWEWLLAHQTLLAPEAILFVDLADPTKRPKKDLRCALETLSQLNRSIRVMLGLNRAECEQVHAATYKKKAPESLLEAVASLRKKLQLHTVIIHTHFEAAAASEDSSASVLVPHVPSPKRSTGAGDTFNGGFLSGILNEKSLQTSLEWAVGASGILVRTGKAPSRQQLSRFCSTYFS